MPGFSWKCPQPEAKEGAGRKSERKYPQRGGRLRGRRKRNRKNKLLHGRKEQDETENLRRYETLS